MRYLECSDSIANGYQGQASRNLKLGIVFENRRLSRGIEIGVAKLQSCQCALSRSIPVSEKERSSGAVISSFEFDGSMATADVRSSETNGNLAETSWDLETRIVNKKRGNATCFKGHGSATFISKVCSKTGFVGAGLTYLLAESATASDPAAFRPTDAVEPDFTGNVRSETNCHQTLTCRDLKFCTSLKNRGHQGSIAVKRSMTTRFSCSHVCIFVMNVS